MRASEVQAHEQRMRDVAVAERRAQVVLPCPVRARITERAIDGIQGTREIADDIGLAAAVAALAYILALAVEGPVVGELMIDLEHAARRAIRGDIARIVRQRAVGRRTGQAGAEQHGVIRTGNAIVDVLQATHHARALALPCQRGCEVRAASTAKTLRRLLSALSGGDEAIGHRTILRGSTGKVHAKTRAVVLADGVGEGAHFLRLRPLHHDVDRAAEIVVLRCIAEDGFRAAQHFDALDADQRGQVFGTRDAIGHAIGHAVSRVETADQEKRRSPVAIHVLDAGDVARDVADADRLLRFDHFTRDDGHRLRHVREARFATRDRARAVRLETGVGDEALHVHGGKRHHGGRIERHVRIDRSGGRVAGLLALANHDGARIVRLALQVGAFEQFVQRGIGRQHALGAARAPVRDGAGCGQYLDIGLLAPRQQGGGQRLWRDGEGHGAGRAVGWRLGRACGADREHQRDRAGDCAPAPAKRVLQDLRPQVVFSAAGHSAPWWSGGRVPTGRDRYRRGPGKLAAARIPNCRWYRPRPCR